MSRRGSTRRHFLLPPTETPCLEALINGTEAEDYLGHTDQFFRLEDLFASFVRSKEVQEIIDRELEELKENPAYIPRGSSGNTMLFADSPKFALTAVILDESHTSAHRVFSAAGDALFGNIGPEPMPIRFHAIPDSCDLEVFDSTQRLVPQAKTSIAVHEIVKVPARKLVAEYLATKKTVLVKLTSRFYLPLIWVYNKTLGIPELCSSGNLHASRLQSTIRLLSELESENETPNQTSIDSLKRLASHPYHFVRWAAVQGLCNMDFSVGKDSLLASLEDAHPHISRAAKSTVERLRLQGVLT